MATARESRGFLKWHSFKDVGTFKHSFMIHNVLEEPGIFMEEQNFHIQELVELVPKRSGSAPPSMDRLFPAIGTDLIDQRIGVNSSLSEFENTPENEESDEKLPFGPANLSYNDADMDLKLHPVDRVSSFRGKRMLNSIEDDGDESLQFSRGSTPTHEKENVEESLPLQASEDLAESSVAATVGKNELASAGLPRSLVDPIQEHFPRVPAVHYQTRTSSHIKTDEQGVDYNDVNTMSLNNPGVGKSPESSSSSYETIRSGDPFLTKGKLSRDESSDKHVNRGYISASETPRIDSRTNLEIKRSPEKQQSHRNNVPRLLASTQADFPYLHPRVRSQTISHGMHQLTGFTSPFTEVAPFMDSRTHFSPNLQPSDLYSPQYNIPGYASGSTVLAPFMSGYSPQSYLPFSSSPGYVGVTTSVSALDRGPLVGDMSTPQHALSNHLHMQVFPQPSQEVYGSPVRDGQFASSGFLRNHFAQPESPVSAYVGDHKAHLNISIPITMKISGYGNSHFTHGMTQLPSSFSTGNSPSSSATRGNHTGHQIERNYIQGSVRGAGTFSEWQGKRSFSDLGGNEKLSLVEEVKSGNAQKIELFNIEGCVADLCFDQHGSRFIQKKLETCCAEDKISVFKEVCQHIPRLMIDVFGNYVIQKFLELGSNEQRKEIADALSGQMLSLSLQMYGCRVIQKALEVIELDQKSLLVKELDGQVMECVHDQNGNHVIQKCIECLPTEEIGFIIASLQGHVQKLSSHPYGCRVIQRVLEHCLDDIQCHCIIEEILESACFLAQDQYGNYVIQHTLKRGEPRERSQIINKLAGKVVQLSQHKYASNVIEKCLKYGNPTEKEHLIDEMLIISEENDDLLAMMKNQYANYVVQKIFEEGNERQKETLLNHTRLHIHALRKFTYGKHIAALFEQRSNEDFEAA